MTILPLQAFGIGDIIFCQTLVRKVANGNPIIWGTLPHFVDGLNRAYPDIKFVDYKTLGIDYDCKEHKEIHHAELGACTLLPIRWADVILKVPYNDCMRAKYQLYGLDWRDWREEAMWVRTQNEYQLCDYQLGEWGSESIKAYTLINDTFGSDSKFKVDINVYSKWKLHMQSVPKYSIFDWAYILENVSTIHTVSTSIIYMLEMLDLRAKEIHLYNRPIKGQGFENIDYILQKHKYIYH